MPAADTDEGRHHIRSSVAGERVASLTGGLVDDASVIELWIDPEDSRVVEVAFDVETDDGPTAWRLLLSDFDEEITISKPDIAD